MRNIRCKTPKRTGAQPIASDRQCILNRVYGWEAGLAADTDATINDQFWVNASREEIQYVLN